MQEIPTSSIAADDLAAGDIGAVPRPLKASPALALADWALADWAFGQSAVAAVLVSQVLTAIGVVYVYRALGLVIATRPAALLAFMFATSIYVVAAPLSSEGIRHGRRDETTDLHRDPDLQ